MSVEVVHWNPRQPLIRERLSRFGPRLNNFGDVLGPVVVNQMLKSAGIRARKTKSDKRLLAIGSIMHLAREGDCIWGTGINGKKLSGEFPFHNVDVRAVRGPQTQRLLQDKGITVPSVFGDPGLLVGQLWDRATLAAKFPQRSVAVVPNFHDFAAVPRDSGAIDPTGDLWSVIGKIAASDLVVGSSLHGIIVAESLGIPARLVLSGTEPLFKYRDYYEGTGRTSFTPAHSVEEALSMGGEQPLNWDPAPLRNAFPYDLWTSSKSTQ